MGRKNKKLDKWQEEQKPAEPTREDSSKAFAKKKPKRPHIKSSHKGG